MIVAPDDARDRPVGVLDPVVLGSTHVSRVRPIIERMLGTDISIITPARGARFLGLPLDAVAPVRLDGAVAA